MKYLLIMFLSLTALAAEPKFYKGQHVTYETGFFLHKACSGKGVIYDVSEDNYKYTYTIRTPDNENDCPNRLDRKETEIKAAKQ